MSKQDKKNAKSQSVASEKTSGAVNKTTSEQGDALAQSTSQKDELQQKLNEAVAENERSKQQVKDLQEALEEKAAAKIVSKAGDQKAFKAALAELKIKPTDVLGHKEYPDKIVIVTKAGQKHIVDSIH